MTVLTSTRPGPSSGDPSALITMCDDDATVASEFDLRDRLLAALAAGPGHLVVDLARCHYLDAPGLRVLVEARDQASRQGTRLELRGCSAHVLRLLEAAGHPVGLWHR